MTVNQPKWNRVCFPLFFFPFLPLLESSLLGSAGEAVPELGAEPHAFGAGPRLSFQRTVPRVFPAIRTLGLAAAGRAGKESAPRGAGAAGTRLEDGAADDGRLTGLGIAGRGKDGGADVAQGVAAAAFPRREEGPAAADRGGKGLEGAFGRAPLLPTAEREDLAVDDFKRKTRLPPVLTAPVDMPGRRPPAGRAG